jgi:hypothetical protein
MDLTKLIIILTVSIIAISIKSIDGFHSTRDSIADIL